MWTRAVEVPALQGATYNGKPAPGWTSYKIFKCGQCQRIRQSTDALTTGYGTDAEGRIFCYECAADNDRAEMETRGEITLYLVKREGKRRPEGARAYTSRVDAAGQRIYTWHEVTNWPGSLSFPVYHLTKGRHNMAGTRYDFCFQDHTGAHWYGTQYGENSQVARCKRRKAGRAA